MKEIAWAAYNDVPDGLEMGLEAVNYYDPPNFTFPFGIYLCVVDIDRGTGETSIRRFYALDDCGTRINPMIIEGQIHGGLTRISQLSNMPTPSMSQALLGPAPTISVNVHRPMPISSPLARFSACSRRSPS